MNISLKIRKIIYKKIDLIFNMVMIKSNIQGGKLVKRERECQLERVWDHCGGAMAKESKYRGEEQGEKEKGSFQLQSWPGTLS